MRNITKQSYKISYLFQSTKQSFYKASFLLLFISSVLLIEQNAESKVLKKIWNANDKINDNNNGDSHRKLIEHFDEYYDDDSFEDLLNMQNFEQQEYYEDGETRYITEDDVEESYNYDSEDTPHRGLKRVHLDPRCPELPQPSKLSENLCKAKSCLTDDDCRYFGNNNINTKFFPKSSPFRGKETTSFCCCFNGCLHTCLRKVEPPIAFDWLEETEMIRPVFDENNKTGLLKASGFYNLNHKTLESSESQDERIRILPGGCYITQKQLDELRLFRKYDHVETCTCFNGEVVCQINPKIYFK